MLKRIRKYISSPESISDALSMIVPKDVASAAAEQYPQSKLIEIIAEEMFYNPEELLAQVAEVFKMYPISKLSAPTKKLVELTGYSPEMLRQHGVVPQSSFTAPAGFSLVLSDPESISVEEFIERGVAVFLSTGKSVERAWQEYVHQKQAVITPVSGSQAFSVVENLAREAKKLGAGELFLGHPDIDKYEFSNTDKQYSGSVHPTVVTSLYTLLTRPNGIDEYLAETSLPGLHVALTRNFTNTIICVSWEQEASVVSPIAIVPPRKKTTSPYEISSGENRKASKKNKVKKESLIVLIDDDDRFSLILSNILKDKGFQVMRASDGEKGMVLLSELKASPELVICDIHMPVMDGPAFLKALRNAGYKIPILMLTSDDDKLLEAELVMLGAEAFVRKQQDPRILLAWCNNLLSRSPEITVGDSSSGPAVKEAYA